MLMIRSRILNSILFTPLLLAINISIPEHGFAELPEGFTGTRPIGMGGAFTAIANDENAFWINPAGIARARKARSRNGVHIGKFPNVSIGINAGSRGLYTTLKGASKAGVADAIASADIISEKPFYVRGASFPVVMFEGGKNQPMGFGFFGNSISKVYIDKDLPSEARVTSITDVGSTIGIAYSNFANRLNLGLALRPTYRYAYENSIPVQELKSSTDMSRHLRKDSNAGVGIGVDIGAMFT
ncbi:MAG: hypothetical protein NTV34_10200, partial [Proteobacteria bacterium]|nr:hypothetical protein [Pseudomonadota bacterium]